MPKLLLPIKSASAYREVADASWLAKPWVLSAGITELVGTQKEAGKTTLLLRGLVRSVLNGSQFLGETCARARVLYLTEQPPSVIKKDLTKAGILDHADLYLLQWHDVAKEKWQDTARKLRGDCKALGIGLVVVDTLGQFTLAEGDSENDNAQQIATLKPLMLLNLDGIGVVIVRHERKIGGSISKAGRGGTAISGAVDIMLRIRRRGKTTPTLRVLEARSRFEETPEELLIELTESGYVKRDKESLELEGARKVVLTALEKRAGLTLSELYVVTKKARATLQRATDDLLAMRRIKTEGEGKKSDPFKFYLTPVAVQA